MSEEPPRGSAKWAELCAAIPAEISQRDLEDELAGNPALDEDERAALWLYAWSRPDRIYT